MKPSRYMRNDEVRNVRYAIVQSYLGWVLIAATTRGICKIAFGDEPDVLKKYLKNDFPNAKLLKKDLDFKTAVTRTLSFIEAPKKVFPLPLDIRGSVFQRRVWSALLTIPPGKTASYSEIAQKIGNPKAARAVARACASNHIAVAIPCHRVVRRNGALGGYRWGIERKKTLIDRELKNTEYQGTSSRVEPIIRKISGIPVKKRYSPPEKLRR